MYGTRYISRAAPAIEAGGRAALLLVGHGSTREPRARATLERHAAILDADSPFVQVRAAVLHGEPSLRAVLAEIRGSPIYVVPHAMCEGLFTRVLLPRALEFEHAAAARSDGGVQERRIICCAPSGSHPRLAAVLRGMVLKACRGHGIAPAATTALLVGHGTPRDPASANQARCLARSLAESDCFLAVALGFLGEAPFAAKALAALDECSTVVVGLFATEGGHATAELPALLAKARARRADRSGRPAPLLYAGVLGADPAITDLIIEQVSAAGPALGAAAFKALGSDA